MLTATIAKNPCNDAMRAMALRLFPLMSWRHHGIGCLQGYISESTEPEVRLHVWSRRLLKPGMDESGDIHDHRFRLVSHVLCGGVGHEEITIRETEAGAWAMMELTHARAAKESGYHGLTRPMPGRFIARRESMIVTEGFTYQFPAGLFHRSPLPGEGDIAVTCVEKHEQSDARARILYPVAIPPVMAFGHEMDWAAIGPVLQLARTALGEQKP